MGETILSNQIAETMRKAARRRGCSLSVRLLGALIISSAMGALLGPEMGPEALVSAHGLPLSCI